MACALASAVSDTNELSPTGITSGITCVSNTALCGVSSPVDTVLRPRYTVPLIVAFTIHVTCTTGGARGGREGEGSWSAFVDIRRDDTRKPRGTHTKVVAVTEVSVLTASYET